MRNIPLFSAMVASIVVLGFSGAAHGQAESQKTAQPTQHRKPAAKTRKVWTNDDLGSLHSRADVNFENQQVQNVAPARQDASGQQASPTKPGPQAHPPKLSNPKTAEDADKMIAWENRDIGAQQEYVERLQKEQDEAPADQKERLQALIVQGRQTLADTRKEMQGLVEQKKKLEKKSSAGNTTSSAKPPSQ